MPARSKAQQALFGMALAVRKGEMKRSEVNKEVLELVDSNISNQDLKDFASTSHKGLKDHVKEALYAKAIANITDRAFIVIKPEFLRYSQEIVDMFKDEGFVVIGMKLKKLTLDEAKKLYRIHKDQSFYDDLCQYMASGLSLGVLLKNDKQYYDLFKVIDTLKEKVRKKYGVDEMRNAIHGSDSKENMEKESKIYF